MSDSKSELEMFVEVSTNFSSGGICGKKVGSCLMGVKETSRLRKLGTRERKAFTAVDVKEVWRIFSLRSAEKVMSACSVMPSRNLENDASD